MVYYRIFISVAFIAMFKKRQEIFNKLQLAQFPVGVTDDSNFSNTFQILLYNILQTLYDYSVKKGRQCLIEGYC
ncbi:hypothetical protein D0817_02475 [Flavobacterium cupreum]|uniref:Uncharacterized protein n=1 Tax=Flavobacterium cupreum TaxID=2133766 RepID=A0A434ADP7_9FLAO|nr:hypothetical protein D0817_02475 [Flavobacterium cupreum]